MRLRPLMSIFKVQLIKRNQKRKVLSWIQWHFHRLQPLLQVSGLWHIMWMWIHYLHVLISFLTLKTLALEAHALSRLFCGLSWATEWQLKIAIDLVNCSNISKRAFYIKTHLSGSWLENLHRSQNLHNLWLENQQLGGGWQSLSAEEIWVTVTVDFWQYTYLSHFLKLNFK